MAVFDGSELYRFADPASSQVEEHVGKFLKIRRSGFFSNSRSAMK
jgi:hypothetical protein